jgi:hypothetical protein
MEKLPLELHYAILARATNLFSLRAVNKHFWAIATPSAFRFLMVRNSRKHAEGLLNLQGSSALRSYVAELALEYPQGEENIEQEHSDSGGKSKFRIPCTFPADQTLRYYLVS